MCGVMQKIRGMCDLQLWKAPSCWVAPTREVSWGFLICSWVLFVHVFVKGKNKTKTKWEMRQFLIVRSDIAKGFPGTGKTLSLSTGLTSPWVKSRIRAMQWAFGNHVPVSCSFLLFFFWSTIRKNSQQILSAGYYFGILVK